MLHSHPLVARTAALADGLTPLCVMGSCEQEVWMAALPSRCSSAVL